jgi:RNA polymerase sigma factor (sigma-70 family)
LEESWKDFHQFYSDKIRAYAFTCGAKADEVADCLQEVWRELLVRLPTFHFDPTRGQFDTWLFPIVQSKAADLCRLRKRRFHQYGSHSLAGLPDAHPNPCHALEDRELLTLVWDQIKKRLTACNFQILRLRLVDQTPVAEVAQKLGLSHEQVWYRFHRARTELQAIGSSLARGNGVSNFSNGELDENSEKSHESAQGNNGPSVPRSVEPSLHARQGGPCVDYVFQRLELGRREQSPEWKVEWDCEGEPKPILYIRKTAIVAYAELCGNADFINTHLPRIVNAAIAAGVAAGIATIIATPTAALPIFQAEFHKQLQGKGGGSLDEQIHVALSARQEANGPWWVCKS